jgi:cyanophycin synthetase
VTGTNGKTTCTRLASFILGTAGHRTGVSCTDWLSVDDHIIERGDWSGPGGARTILRQPVVTAAILETARGGLLRRGLGVDHADVALITNIAEDHLGDFGSRNLDELLAIKWIISRSVKDNGTLVLNADDERLVEKAKDYTGRITWFSLDASSPVIDGHLAASQTAFFVDSGVLVRAAGQTREQICAETDIPITMKGAARHNTANALAAAALTNAMGVPLKTIGSALKAMTPASNPGRCNIYDVQGVSVLVDFAHNPHAMAALFNMAEALPAKRRLLAFGQAGDRPDHSIRELSQAAWAIGLDRVFVSELAEYHRGRDHGEVFGVISRALVEAGADNEQVRHFEMETDALRHALEWAQPGDLVIMLALGARDDILLILDKVSASGV